MGHKEQLKLLLLIDDVVKRCVHYATATSYPITKPAVVSNNKWTFGAVVEHSIHAMDASGIVMRTIDSYTLLLPFYSLVLVYTHFQVFCLLKNHRVFFSVFFSVFLSFPSFLYLSLVYSAEQTLKIIAVITNGMKVW